MILDEICAHKAIEVAAQRTKVPMAALEERIAELRPARPFRTALRQQGTSLIAEVKMASPTKGTFLRDVDPVELAGIYESAGARAISVLTDERYFHGRLDYLTAIHKSVKVPCLRKEFIIDAYQIYEARAAEADAILLIVRCLSDAQLKEYLGVSSSLGMDVLVECHDPSEIDRALKAGAHIIGINNRNLDTFAVDVKTTLELKKLVPGGHTLVSESGIFTREDVVMLEDGGVDAILVGEAIVTSRDFSGKVRELIGADAH